MKNAHFLFSVGENVNYFGSKKAYFLCVFIGQIKYLHPLLIFSHKWKKKKGEKPLIIKIDFVDSFWAHSLISRARLQLLSILSAAFWMFPQSWRCGAAGAEGPSGARGCSQALRAAGRGGSNASVATCGLNGELARDKSEKRGAAKNPFKAACGIWYLCSFGRYRVAESHRQLQRLRLRSLSECASENVLAFPWTRQ